MMCLERCALRGGQHLQYLLVFGLKYLLSFRLLIRCQIQRLGEVIESTTRVSLWLCQDQPAQAEHGTQNCNGESCRT